MNKEQIFYFGKELEKTAFVRRLIKKTFPNLIKKTPFKTRMMETATGLGTTGKLMLGVGAGGLLIGGLTQPKSIMND